MRALKSSTGVVVPTWVTAARSVRERSSEVSDFFESVASSASSSVFLVCKTEIINLEDL